MEETSRLIRPLICTQVMSTMTTIVPGHESGGVHGHELREATSWGELSRFRQVILTSLPLLMGDILALSSCYIISSLIAFWLNGTGYHTPGVWNNLMAVCLCHIMWGSFLGLFPASGINPVRELRNQLTSVGGSFLVLIALNGLVGEVAKIEVLTISIALPLTLFFAPLARFTSRRMFARFRWWGESVIIVGSGRQARLVYEFLERQPQRGLKPLGIVDSDPNNYWLSGQSEPFEFLGKTSDLVSVCRQRNCHWVIATVADRKESEVIEILTQGSLIHNLVVLSSNVMMPTMWVEPFDAAGLPGIHVKDRLLFPMLQLSKRLTDIVLSGIMLVLSLPLIAVVTLWIKMVSPGPVFFCHQGRVGRFGRPFGAYKIRSMVQNAQQILEEHLNSSEEARAEWEKDHKLKNDPRIIAGIGHFLRRTSLDELPQLWNVMKGDMSLVGPRPIVVSEQIRYGEIQPLYLRVRPGLTGLWQVSGRNNTSYSDRVKLDAYYVRNWSLWLDYFILLRTVRTVLLREGSY